MQDLTKNITDVLNIVNIINDKLSSIDSKKVDKAIMSSFRDSINILLEATKIINDASKLDYFKQLTDEINKINQQKILYETYKQTLTNISKKLVDNIPLTEKENELLTNIPYTPTNIYECLNIVTGSILSIFKSISDLNKIEAVNPIKLLWNIEITVMNLKYIINKIPDIFKQIDTNKLQDIVLSLSTSSINKVTEEKNGDKKIKTTDSINKMSVIDLIKAIFDLINSLADIKTVNPINLLYSIKVLEITISLLINSIENIYTLLNSVYKKNKRIIESGKSASEAISSVFNNLSSIQDSIIKISKNTFTAILLIPITILMVKMTGGLINYILKVFSNIGAPKKLQEHNDNTEHIKDIINNILSISFYIITSSILLLPLIPSIIISITCVLGIATFIKLTEIIFNTAKRINIRSINRTTQKIHKIIKKIILIGLSVVSLALLTPIILPATLVSTICLLGIIAFVVLLKLLLKIGKIRLKDLLALTVLNIAIGLLITLSLGVLALSKIGKKIDWKSLLIMMGAILMVSVFSILIGFAAMTIIGVIGLAMVGLMALIMLIGVLFVIAGMLYILQIVELDTEIIKGNIKFLLGLCEEIAVIVKDKLNKESLKAIGIATLNLGALLPMTAVLLLLAGGLWLLQHIDLNRDKIRETVETVIGTATSIIDMIFGEKEEPETEKSDKTWIGGLLEGVGGFMGNLKVVLDAILAVGFLATTVASVAIILLIGKLLNKVSELNIDENISQKVGKIIETAKNISKQVLGTSDSTAQVVKQEEEKSWLGKTWDNIKGFGGKVINTATSLISNIGAAGVLATILPSIMMLGSIVDLIQSINDLKLDPNINNKVANIVDLAKNITSQVSSSKTIGSIDEDKVDLFGEYVDDSIKYFKNINKLDVSKVKSLGEMYDKMGQFMDKLSDAPISEIADALVNKISPALSDINNNLDKKTTSTTSQQNTQQTSTTSQQNIQQIDYTTILENIEDLLEKIKQKMNENTQLSFS